MNTVVSFDWWNKSITVAFTDYNTAHYFSLGNVVYMLDIGKNRTLRGAKSHIRREVSSKHDVTLSRMRLVKDTPPVTFLLAKRVEKEN